MSFFARDEISGPEWKKALAKAQKFLRKDCRDEFDHTYLANKTWPQIDLVAIVERKNAKGVVAGTKAMGFQKSYGTGLVSKPGTWFIQLVCSTRGSGLGLEAMNLFADEARKRKLKKIQLAALAPVVSYYRSKLNYQLVFECDNKEKEDPEVKKATDAFQKVFKEKRDEAYETEQFFALLRLYHDKNLGVNSREYKAWRELPTKQARDEVDPRPKCTQSNLKRPETLLNECSINGYVMTLCLDRNGVKIAPIPSKASSRSRSPSPMRPSRPSSSSRSSSAGRTKKKVVEVLKEGKTRKHMVLLRGRAVVLNKFIKVQGPLGDDLKSLFFSTVPKYWRWINVSRVAGKAVAEEGPPRAPILILEFSGGGEPKPEILAQMVEPEKASLRVKKCLAFLASSLK